MHIAIRNVPVVGSVYDGLETGVRRSALTRIAVTSGYATAPVMADVPSASPDRMDVALSCASKVIMQRLWAVSRAV